jgi:hypothetical protein
LADYYPSADLTLILLTYLNTPKNEMLLNSSMQIGERTELQAMGKNRRW